MHLIKALLFGGVFLLAGMSWTDEAIIAATRAKAQILKDDGNVKEAYELFAQLALDPQNFSADAGKDLQNAVATLTALNRLPEFDAFLEKVVAVHAGHWRVLSAAAATFDQVQSGGVIVAGEYQRGPHRGGRGRFVDSRARDRARALQLMTQALPLVQQEQDRKAASKFYEQFAALLLRDRQYGGAWQLQVLTDLQKLPDYEEGNVGYYRWRWGWQDDQKGAPVQADGAPVLYFLPATYDQAKNDGERWRWMLNQAMLSTPSVSGTNSLLLQWADFLRDQFGVQTMASQFRPFAWEPEGEDTNALHSPFALHTLSDDETMARLATGVRRLTLPAEFNYLRVYQTIADNPQCERALERLAQCYEDRRQYERAAQYWRRNIAEYGPGANKYKVNRLEQIEGNWGELLPVASQSARRGATVEYRFRNGRAVSFEAHRIKDQLLLDDIKNHVNSRPEILDHQKLNIDGIGWRIVHENEKRYLGEKVAEWQQDLQPRSGHFDRRITITTPLQEAGVYLLTARMRDGNVSKIVLWVADTVLVQKQCDGAQFFYLADAVNGQPVPDANVEFFGYKQDWVEGTKRFDINILNFAERTDANGQILLENRGDRIHHNWLIIARTPQGRLAYLGFTGLWWGRQYDEVYNQKKVFFISDRPVYRPAQSVKFKFWMRRAQYDQSGADFANQSYTVEIYDPKGEKVWSANQNSDQYGGLAGEYTLPRDATLGNYSIHVVSMGSGSFRVEEYKKPEFEVRVDAPAEPVALGDTITATLQAKYYFGAPVSKGKVKYKITRVAHQATWYPSAPWDWLYGCGYGWFGYDYIWYPRWREWGCWRPLPPWWHVPVDPPELVAENEVALDPSGVLKIEIDTSLAKAMHGDQDHRYEITAEVTDESRRVIVGQGSILVARRPFKVYAWLHRGHYRVGDTVHAEFQAQTLDKKPVAGQGQVTLNKIQYDADGTPRESVAQTWDLNPDAQGRVNLQFKASAAGQYRLVYRLRDAKEQSIEGACIFCVAGEGFDGRQYRFNSLELVPDRREYAPGETVRLRVNTERPDSTVLLFIRPANQIAQAPKTIRLNGKSVLEEIEVLRCDMPNFFVEAITISDGQIHNEICEIAVPPVSRVVAAEVLPAAEKVKPGAATSAQVRLTDPEGKPFQGSVVLSVYDKAVEYIAGGGLPADIREFFWKWRRSHSPRHASSLGRTSVPLVDPGQPAMQALGVFGRLNEEAYSEHPADRRHENSLALSGARGGIARQMFKSDVSDAKPMTTMAPMAEADALGADAEVLARADGGSATGELAVPLVRTNFADTAFWNAALTPDSNGVVKVEFNAPESLTTWKIRAWAMGANTEVGEAEASFVTAKNLLLRMQAPRFFVERDQVTLSANIHNYLDSAKSVTALLDLTGDQLKALGATRQNKRIDAGDEQRVDWQVQATHAGEARVGMQALTDEESDAMAQVFPVYTHGMLKMDAFSGSLREERASGEIVINVPAERRPEESRLEVRYSPSLAAALVDALPYLAAAPEGCTDQVLNRFLPAVICQNVLQKTGVDLAMLREAHANLNAQEIGDPQERAQQWKRYADNPIFNEAKLTQLVKDNLQHLTAMQCDDGGWGWFSGYGERSWPHTTAYVVHGLQMAVENRLALVPGVLERGVAWLKEYQAEQVKRLQDNKQHEYANNLDALVFMVLTDAGEKNQAMLDFLYRDRNRLAAYGKALYGLALHKLGEQEKLAMIMRNLEQLLVQDDENQTAWLELGNGYYWWYWYGCEYEAHAYYLKLLNRVEPGSERSARLVKYLLNNRKHASYWNSTRDTALCIEAMAEYLLASGEDKPDMTVTILLDGKERKTVQINATNLFSFDDRLIVEGADITTGQHKIELRVSGRGALYYNAYLSYFTLEDFIKHTGLEIKVNRAYYKLEPEKKSVAVSGARGQALEQRVEKYKRVPLQNGSVLKSGDLVEVELEIDSKNDYEYIVFNDMKAAGFEPVQVRSGYGGNELGAYMELRDERVSFFVRTLARGKNSVSYRLRAEIPGHFSALPARAAALYAPELKANSDEIKLSIED